MLNQPTTIGESTCAKAPRWNIRRILVTTSAALAIILCIGTTTANTSLPTKHISLGPRPFHLVDALPAGELKTALQACDASTITPQPFSIGHRGAPLQFPEHTRESYIAAARMGAGIIECDVTFTKDRQLVCRHSQCDLHTTTNILATPLAEKCSSPPKFSNDKPFTDVQCCTSDITLDEFKTLKGKMDAGNPEATRVEDYLNATASWRTDLYSERGTLMTHRESIELFNQLGVSMTPELKEALVPLPFDGDYSRTAQADQMLDEYRAAGIDPAHVWPQSFEEADIQHWINTAPDFAAQVILLDDRYKIDGFHPMHAKSWTPSMQSMADSGLKWLAPPTWMLVTLNNEKQIVPSAYAVAAKEAGLGLITWTLERSGSLVNGGDWLPVYFPTGRQLPRTMRTADCRSCSAS